MKHWRYIRRAVPDDAEALAKVHVDSWRKAYRGLVPDAYLDSLSYAQRTQIFRENLRHRGSETYCIECDDEIVGVLTLGGCRDPDVDPQVTGEIWGIYLTPTHWRQGFGRQLCRYGEERLKLQGYGQITLWVFEENQAARRFYEAMGFTIDGGHKVFTPGGKELQAVRYRKTV
jgi:RimJ/RimL family protein N-acetyltransferase